MKLTQSKVHFIGIGGIGMSGIAELLHNMGAQVSGSDLGENAQTARLKSLGVRVIKGHAAENLEDAEVVVYSSAVKPDNSEYIAAKEKALPIIPRAQALAEIMQLKRGIAIGGSHGKTTTTSFTATLFLKADLDPTIVVGGRLDLIQATSKLGSGEWMIAEADESDGSFHRLAPEIAIVTNIDNDHLDFYKNLENLRDAFKVFADRVPFYGQVIACGDDEDIREAFADLQKPVVYYGMDPKNDFYLTKKGCEYTVHEGETAHVTFQLNLHGQHNALNALAAMLAGRAAGLDWAPMAKQLEAFTGVDRRMSFKGDSGSVKVYDDYGHHPTEVTAVIDAFKERYPKKELVVLFQPHRYSRTQLCWDDFTKCFRNADRLLLTDIYAAGESPIPGVTGQEFFLAVDHKAKNYIVDLKADAIRPYLSEDCVFVTLGAGNVWQVGEALVKGS